MKLTKSRLRQLIIEQIDTMTAADAVDSESGTGDIEILEAIYNLAQDFALNITGLSDKSMQMAILQHVDSIKAMVDAIMDEVDEATMEMPTQSYDQIPP